jgi:hypothetical protein
MQLDFVGIGTRLRSVLCVSWLSLTQSSVQFARVGFMMHVMSGWVAEDVFDELAEYIKNIKQKLQHMYVCVPLVRKSTTDRDRNLLGK